MVEGPPTYISSKERFPHTHTIKLSLTVALSSQFEELPAWSLALFGQPSHVQETAPKDHSSFGEKYLTFHLTVHLGNHCLFHAKAHYSSEDFLRSWPVVCFDVTYVYYLFWYQLSHIFYLPVAFLLLTPEGDHSTYSPQHLLSYRASLGVRVEFFVSHRRPYLGGRLQKYVNKKPKKKYFIINKIYIIFFSAIAPVDWGHLALTSKTRLLARD